MFKCPLMCNCLLFAIDCRNTSLINIKTEIQPFYLSVSISSSDIFSFTDLDDKLENAIVVKLIMNCITEIFKLTRLQKILLLDLGFNCLKLIMKNVFASLHLLQTLSLNDNDITLLETNAFYNLSNLKYINLSNNPLMNLQEGFLKYSLQLKLFYIVNVSFVDVHAKALHDLHINVIITTEYHLCCISSNETLCPTYKPWYISCSDILPNDSVKVYFLSVSCLVLLLNVTSILFYLQTIKSNKTFSILVISINLNDILCGIYLGCIWLADMIYRGTFLVKENIWRSGPICFAAFGIILWFTILTQLVLIFLSLSRLMTVIYPIGTKFKKVEFVLKSIVLFYTSSFLVTLWVTFYFKLTYLNLPLSLCLPFIDPTNSVGMTKIITWSVFLTQTTSSVVIMSMHLFLVKKLKQSKKRIKRYKLEGDSQTPLIMQLTAITTSNIICWFPTNAIYVAAMFLSIYPIDLIIWTTVSILPLNSIINPSVFLVTSCRKYIKSKNKTKDMLEHQVT